jgi:predicted transcriptional regulator
LRQQRGLECGDLAERAGVSPEHLARIEAGDDKVEFPPVQRLVDAMGCTLDDLAVTPGARFEG